MAFLGRNTARQFAGRVLSRSRLYRRPYPVSRAYGEIPSPSVFQDTGYEPKQPTILSVDLSLTATLELDLAGNWVWYQNSTNATDTFALRYNDSAAAPINMLPGNKIGGIAYTKLFITPPGIAGAFATFIVMQDTPQEPIEIL